MKKALEWLWSKIGFCSFKTDGANLQISVNYSFFSGLVIGTIAGAVLW